MTYDVYFGTSEIPPFKVTIGPYPATETFITYDLEPLDYNTTYYWRIVATDNHAASTSGPVWDFTTGAAADCPWLDENPKSGSVEPGYSDSITVTIDTTGLTPVITPLRQLSSIMTPTRIRR